ncbi:hypothetical protein GCM10009122_17160 [Fulvivirga kasyanovii]|uniref:SF4 helicase domain-containing protein n=1 Tax=Fulvivirga kasyanovii TaxID=396812 RepID=A0ABW9RR21_9BACT|nr:DnaB-like helicase C-terminal domain-containing protein [Fulvivirga kasyanovii]MTI26476.1 hypothetical protein [Fulvivirga kasyanovii]
MLKSLSELIKENIVDYELRINSEFGLNGIPSGFVHLDNVLCGWQKSELITIAGMTSVGKTSLMLSAVRNASVEFGIPTAIFSYENSSNKIVDRLFAMEAEIEMMRLNKGKLAAYEWEQLIHKTRELNHAPIFIDDNCSLTLEQLLESAEEIVKNNNIEALFIDDIHHIRVTKTNREQEISYIVRELKRLARLLNIPIIALSRINRRIFDVLNKRPSLEHLKDSGDIEHHSDTVLLLNRPEMHGITEDENGESTLGIMELIIAKHRHGSLEQIPLKFIQKFAKITDLEANNFGFNNEPMWPSNSDFSEQVDPDNDAPF